MVGARASQRRSLAPQVGAAGKVQREVETGLAKGFACGLVQNCPDLIDPLQVLRFHQDGAQACHLVTVALHLPSVPIGEFYGQLGQRQMKPPL